MTATYIAPDQGAHHPMIDGDHVAKATVEATDGGFEVFVIHASATPPVPQHVSPWSGLLYVLDGTVTVEAEGFTGDVPPGGAVVIPAGTPATFRVAEGTADFLAVTSGKGAGRFFAEMSEAVPADRPIEESFGAIAPLLARHGVALAGVRSSV